MHGERRYHRQLAERSRRLANALTTAGLRKGDLDGNGIELYYDRPRGEWFDEHGRPLLKAERFDPNDRYPHHNRRPTHMHAQRTHKRAGVKPATTTTPAQRKDRVELSWTLAETPQHGRRLTASWSLPNQSRRLDRPCLHRRPATRVGGTMPGQRAQIDRPVADEPIPAFETEPASAGVLNLADTRRPVSLRTLKA